MQLIGADGRALIRRTNISPLIMGADLIMLPLYVANNLYSNGLLIAGDRVSARAVVVVCVKATTETEQTGGPN